ncbi:MAG: recombinase family protein [Actinomycetota bacterium]
MTAGKKVRVGIYARVSKADKDDPSSIPVQLADCRDRATEEGWGVVAEYTDHGISAWNPSRKRPEFERLLADVGAGGIDTVLVREQERLLRKLKDGVRLLELAEAGKLRRIACTMESDIDLSRARDRKDFRDRVSSAVFYSEFLAEKIQRTHARKAEAGEWKGGGSRMFGYTEDHTKLVPKEARAIQRAAQDVLAGKTLTAVAREWNAAGLRTPAKGNEWTQERIRQTLMSASIAGLREYRQVRNGKYSRKHSEVVGIFAAQWPAIIDRETHEALRVYLNDPERLKYGTARARSHAFTGLVFCECGAKMTGHPSHNGTRKYICRSGVKYGGCGKNRIPAQPLEAYLVERLYYAWGEWLATHDEVPAPNKVDEDALREVKELKASLEQLARDHYGAKLIGRAEYLAARKELAGRLETAEKALAARHRRSPQPHLRSATDLFESAVDPTDADLRENPKELTFWRALADELLGRVLVKLPTKYGEGSRFSDERLTITWRAV